MQASKYLITLAFVLATAVHAAAEDWVLIETKTAEANGTQIKASDWGNTKTFKRESADVRTLDERTEFAITTADGAARGVSCSSRMMRSTASTTTMASSTTMPIASATPKRLRVLMVNPTA